MTDPLILATRPRDLGSFFVRRALPAVERRLVGPFIFFDHMGPAVLPPGKPLEVRPHPHIGLATVTYLFEGEVLHRDSLGTQQIIRPGAVNWMTAGRGIVHSERGTPHQIEHGGTVHAIQLWLALPLEHEETEPAFVHYPEASIPASELPGASLRVVIGEAYGVASPVATFSPTFYVEARLQAGATLALPEYEERAAYVVEGSLSLADGRVVDAGSMVIWSAPKAADSPVQIVAATAARVMLLGGAKLAGERHIFWNFVSSSKERLEQAKRDWREQRFDKVVGDEVDFIPLPE